jgi:hypothetical protein
MASELMGRSGWSSPASFSRLTLRDIAYAVAHSPLAE